MTTEKYADKMKATADCILRLTENTTGRSMAEDGEAEDDDNDNA